MARLMAARSPARSLLTSSLVIGQFITGRLVVASQDITADAAEVGEQLSCTYRRTSQVALNANSPAEPPTSVACIRLPHLVQVVQLACTGCRHVYEPGLTNSETGHTGGPRCGGWTWIAELGAARAKAGGDGP
jgi:hypothetical protein